MRSAHTMVGNFTFCQPLNTVSGSESLGFLTRDMHFSLSCIAAYELLRHKKATYVHFNDYARCKS